MKRANPGPLTPGRCSDLHLCHLTPCHHVEEKDLLFVSGSLLYSCLFVQGPPLLKSHRSYVGQGPGDARVIAMTRWMDGWLMN